jgi:predicted SAM-dependent methyltransferase
MNEKTILDIGCGASKVPGSVGIDQYQLPGVDVVHDLASFPWPVGKHHVDHIIFSHSLSHLEDISKVMTECHRILKPGGIIEIVAPHFSSDNFNTDPTHKVHLGYRSMNYFVNNTNMGYRYIDEDVNLQLVEANLSFRNCPTSWRKSSKFNPFKMLGLEKVINTFPRVYERFFCWILPTSEVYFKLEKKK